MVIFVKVVIAILVDLMTKLNIFSELVSAETV